MEPDPPTAGPNAGLPARSAGPAALLALAAAALAAYPALRGSAVEDGLAAAELYARPAWLWAHVLAMAGLVLVAAGLSAVDRAAHRATVVATALLLPYYGAEAYGLHAVGRRVVETGDAAVLSAGDGAADLFRYEPVAVTLFALGWVALAVAGARLVVVAVRRSPGPLAGAGLVLTAVALATYLPQFFLPPGGRVAHGVLAAVGLLLLAADRAGAAQGQGAAPATLAVPARTLPPSASSSTVR
ncbi:hypothetical protein INN71_06985 [Nocardioides sp. ChNu-153]|uniref:hypothetical protein n=1 Tax=unclassified Nocardioides TaxID=2615069 RepID=UPI002406F1B7|nr:MULTISPECIES: hypothetical protein [unclassified Nocardioides]MDF9716717.1 hypothetical protein [Nocardioides sp. ChNu-99]MDN7121134.1 hypothetical protein [Nocardioides sp. ChNu-153]